MLKWWWTMLDTHWLAILILAGLVVVLNGLVLWRLAGRADALLATVRKGN
jgi:hypothetical protein